MSLRDPKALDATHPKRVALVIANPAVSTTTGWPAGFWWSELTHPYHEFIERGYHVEVFSPRGGKCEPDAYSDPRDARGYSATDPISMGFIHTPALAGLVEHTRPVSDIRDGNLVTGQQNFSGAETARAVVEALGA